MKRVILLGDSIRMGYGSYVQKALEGSAEVYAPTENCRFTPYMLRNLHVWIQKSGFGQETDCLHWNVGLWDCLELFEDGPQTPLEIYEFYMERICRRIRLLLPNTKVIFATSTPVWEEAYTNPNSMRHNSVIEAYNAAAVKIVTKYGFQINDLYARMKDVPKHYYSDQTHFNTREAAQWITEQVVSTICDATGAKASPVDFDAIFAEKEANKNG